MTDGFWDQLGVDEGGLPTHLPMGVTKDGEGPEDDALAHHYVCWCGDTQCPLTVAFTLAGRASWEQGRKHYEQNFISCPDDNPFATQGGVDD